MHINNSVLYEAEKKQFLVDRTVYIKIIKRIASEQGLSFNIVQDLSLDDKQLNKKANQIIKDFAAENRKRVLKCSQHIKQYVLKSGNNGCTDLEIIRYYTSLGYTENQVRSAIEYVVKQDKNAP